MLFQRATLRATRAMGSLLLAVAAPAPGQERDVVQGLRDVAQPLADSAALFRTLGAATQRARVIGLGEATHGQHEAFDLKRRLTMALVRDHGVRVVAYEASASRARRIDQWIHGGPGDIPRAMEGFGMLIWAIEENAELLRDLRQWNARAAPKDRVRFIGVDAQDGTAVADRLRELLGPARRSLAAQVDTLVARAPAVTQRLFQGQRGGFDSLQVEVAAVVRTLRGERTNHPEQDELAWRATELQAHLGMFGTPGGRDRAMAELLLAQLAPGERAVLWAHNAHIRRSTLDFMGSTDPAMGGHLAQTLRDGYYAVGFAFGSGGFQANAPDSSGRWGYRRYQHEAPATGSLEATLAAASLGDFFVDLRALRAGTSLDAWMRAPHGHRWWGGYNVPDDADARTRDASQLMPMVPTRDFDGLVFHLRTTAATPVDRSRILPPRS